MPGKKISHIEGKLSGENHAVRIEISNGLISGIERVRGTGKIGEENLFVVPGFIDNQLNGYLGIDFTGPDLTTEKIKKVTKALWQKGVTTYLPTLVTNSAARFVKNLKILAEAVQDSETGASIPGFHLEGPYISPEDGFRGAHDKKWVRLPDWDEFQSFIEASGQHILQVTLAPEMNGAIEFIRRAHSENIVVALGHHNASSETIRKAIQAGASTVTHLGNGCANLINRHHNPLWPQLADDRLMASIIVDGKHLTKDEIRTFYKAKGPENTILTSDITKFAGLEPGEYTWDGRKIILTENGYVKYPDQGVLAGSALTLDIGVANMVRFSGCSLRQSIQMATKNPAALYSLDDRGVIKPGKRADLIIFSYDSGDIDIRQTVVGGKIVYEAEKTNA